MTSPTACLRRLEERKRGYNATQPVPRLRFGQFTRATSRTENGSFPDSFQFFFWIVFVMSDSAAYYSAYEEYVLSDVGDDSSSVIPRTRRKCLTDVFPGMSTHFTRFAGCIRCLTRRSCISNPILLIRTWNKRCCSGASTTRS